MAVTYTYPGTGAGAASTHPYVEAAEHGISEPFTLANPLDANAGPGAYSDNMWQQLASLKDIAVNMALLEKFRLTSVYRPFVPTQIAMRNSTGALAEEMTWQGVYAIEPNIETVGRKQIWFTSNYTDVFKKRIVFEDHADKIALHEYDDMTQAYLFRGQIGLVPMCRTLLGESVVTALDLLARNAYIGGPRFHTISGGGTVTSGGADLPQFTGISTADPFDLSLSRLIWEQMAYDDLPMAANPNGVQGNLFCVTTPSTPNVILSEPSTTSQWREANLYANPGMLLRHEVGQYDNTRYLSSRRNVLWNCGDITVQAATTAAYGPGDGAAATLVDGVYEVGQSSGVSNIIECDDVTGFAVNDVVTIHTTRTADFGVTNGVDYREGNARVRRVIEVNGGAGGSLAFDKPLFMDYPIGTFITKAEHIHCSIYIGGPSVVNGVGVPISIYPMAPIDDAAAIYRFIWKGRFKYQQFTPEWSHVVFHGGSIPTFGIGTGP